MTLEPVQLNAEVINDCGSLSGGSTMRATATVPRPGRLRIMAVAVIAGLLLAACSTSTSTSSSPGSSTTATAASSAASSPTLSPTSAVCEAAAELRTSVDALAHVKIGQGTVDELKSDLADVEAKFTALTAELRDANKAQTDAVKSALDALKTAISDFSAHPSSSTLRGVTNSVHGVTTTVHNLLTSLAPQCGSALASPTP